MAENDSAPRRSGKAVASLVFGLASFIPLLSILAVVFGHLALSNIRKSPGKLGGGQFAVTGLVFGYLGLLWTIMYVHYQLRSPFLGAGWGPAAVLRTISSAANMYSVTYSNGYPPSLEALGPSNEVERYYVDALKGVHHPDDIPNCNHAGLIPQILAGGLMGGYKFSYVAQMPDQAKWTPSAEAKGNGCIVAGVSSFTATAEPISSAKDLPSYFVDQTGIIRMSKTGPATANSPPIDPQ